MAIWKKVRIGAGVAALAATLCFGGALSAQATTSQTGFNSTVPRMQQSHYWEGQNKTTSSASQVYFSSIGASYTMNVKAESQGNGQQYAEKKGIGRGSAVPISNGTPIGTSTRLIVTNNVWAVVTVSVSGWFKTN